MSTAPIASLADAWAAMVTNAERSLAAVEAGDLRASTKHLATWRRVLANDELLRRPIRLVDATDCSGDTR